MNNDYMKQYRKSHERQHRVYMKSYTRQNRDRINAMRTARKAYAKGLIESKPCFKCGVDGQVGEGEKERLFFYHEDYRNPRNVLFVCGKCKLQLKHDLQELEDKIDDERGNWIYGTENR